MKILSIVLAGIVVNAFMFLSSCKPDEPTEQEVQLKKLMSKTWLIQSVKVNGVDKTSLFDAMTIAFTKDSFTVVNGSIVWPTSGSWEFTDSKGIFIRRNDDVTINIESLTETDLRLSFTWAETTFGPGRTTSIGGVHIFDFN